MSTQRLLTSNSQESSGYTEEITVLAHIDGSLHHASATNHQDSDKIDEENKHEDDHGDGSQSNSKSKEQAEHEEKLTVAVIRDQCIEKMTDAAIGVLSWMLAAIFQPTLSNTFFIEGASDLENAWFLFFVTLVLAIILIILPLLWTDTKSEQFKKQLLGDSYQPPSKQSDESHDEEKRTSHEEDADADEKEANPEHVDERRPFTSRVEYLLQSAISLVVSMALRDAAQLSFQEKVLEEQNIDTAAYILYAVVWTVFGVWITIRLNNTQDRVKDKLIKSGVFEQADSAENHAMIYRYTMKCKYLAFFLQTIGLIMAWAWRQAIDSFVLSMYGGDKTTTPHVWTYCITVTITISFLVSLSDHFYCLYPREESTQSLFLRSKTVEAVNTLIFDNCKFVVAFAWKDTIALTVFYNSTANIAFNVFVLYWLVGLLMIVISIYVTNKYTQKDMKQRIDEIGIQQWVKKTRKSVKKAIKHQISGHKASNADESLASDYSKLQDGNENENDMEQETFTHYEVPRICKSFGVTIITFTTACWSTSGALFIGDAVRYSVLAIYFDVGSYDAGMEYKRNDTGLWLQWVVALTAVCVSALIMLLLRRSLKLYRTTRISLTEKLSLLNRFKF